MLYRTSFSLHDDLYAYVPACVVSCVIVSLHSPMRNALKCLIMLVCMVIEYPVFHMKVDNCLECELVSSDEIYEIDHSLVLLLPYKGSNITGI